MRLANLQKDAGPKIVLGHMGEGKILRPLKGARLGHKAVLAESQTNIYKRWDEEIENG